MYSIGPKRYPNPAMQVVKKYYLFYQRSNGFHQHQTIFKQFRCVINSENTNTILNIVPYYFGLESQNVWFTMQKVGN